MHKLYFYKGNTLTKYNYPSCSSIHQLILDACKFKITVFISTHCMMFVYGRCTTLADVSRVFLFALFTIKHMFLIIYL